MKPSINTAVGRVRDARGEALNPRRELTAAALACVVGAGLVLLAASRTWQVDFVERPEPLGPLRTEHTGGALVPALPAMGLVALAGAGALFATRGVARRAVGALILVSGVVAAILGGLSAGRVGVAPGWPLLALVGGLVAIAGGGFAALRGASWPALGRRYDLPGRTVHSGQAIAGGVDDRDPVGGSIDRTDAKAAGRADRDLWDALDRGEDPTRS